VHALVSMVRPGGAEAGSKNSHKHASTNVPAPTHAQSGTRRQCGQRHSVYWLAHAMLC